MAAIHATPNQNSLTDSNGIRAEANLGAILEVHRSMTEFASGAHSLIDAQAGSLFAPITGATLATKAYSTVQIGPTEHIELNSNLVYCNHSCAPTMEFDAAKLEVRVIKDRDLKVGDPLTYFYPSTEWDMAQPFKCNCGAKECLGWISGAKDVDRDVLKRYSLNEHIEQLLHQRAIQQGAVNGTKGQEQNETMDDSVL